MSQHHFYIVHEGVRTHVLMGWDKPLQGFFLVIEKDNDDDEPFWSNLNNCIEPYPKTLDFFLQTLVELKIAVPQKMVDAVKQDALLNVGNRDVWY